MQEFVALYKDYWLNLLKFEGRTNRRRFWLTFLIVMVLGAVTFILFNNRLFGVFGYVVRNIFWVVSIVPTLSLWWRRMHDTGRPGWWALVPVMNILFALNASEEENQYGPVPAE